MKGDDMTGTHGTTGTQVKPVVLSKERQATVEAHINRAISALLDAQIEMLMDTPNIYEYELSRRLSPELYKAYQYAQTAENNAVDCFRAMNGGDRYPWTTTKF